MLSAVYLLIKVACFVREVNNTFDIKRSWSKLVSTRRSTVLSLPLQWDLPSLVFVTDKHYHPVKYLREPTFCCSNWMVPPTILFKVRADILLQTNTPDHCSGLNCQINAKISGYSQIIINSGPRPYISMKMNWTWLQNTQ